MKRFCYLLFLALLLGTIVLPTDLAAQKRKTKPTKLKRTSVSVYGGETPRNLTPEQQKRWDSFIKVWETLDLSYFDTTYNGLDWKKIKAEYRPRVLAAKTDLELTRILNDMVWRLNKSHFAIIPKEVYDAVELTKEKAKKAEVRTNVGLDEISDDNEEDEEEEEVVVEDKLARYGVGIDLRMIEGKFVITYIEDPSSAKQAGIKPGYILEKINGVSLSQTVSQIAVMLPGIKNLERVLPFEIQAFMLMGERDTEVTLTCLDENNNPKDFQLTRQRMLGRTASMGLAFPPQYLRFESRSLSEDIGFIKFNGFMLGLLEKFCDALTALKDKKAIIIDLRGNTGGLMHVFQGLTGMFFDRDVEVGTTIDRYGSNTLKAVSKARRFNGKLVVLVDSRSMSAAELFAAGLRDNNRVLLVGERTAGEALPASTLRLATGAIFLFPIANFKTSKGNMIEGTGLEPDIIVNLDRLKLIEGIDNQFEQAIAAIRENRPIPKSDNTTDSGIVKEMRLDKMVKIGSTDETPPPPKAVSPGTGQGSGLGTGRSSPVVEIKDEKAIQILKAADDAVGTEAIKKASSFELTGSGKFTVQGSNVAFDYKAFSTVTPSRYAYTMIFPGDGNLRVVMSREDSFRETFGITETLPQVGDAMGPTGMTDLSKFTSFKYLGDFDREGRKCSVIEAKYRGFTFALAFDVEKKYLVSLAGPGLAASYSDYRSVAEGIMVPFQMEVDHYFKITLTDVKLDVPFIKERFQRTVNCFDVPL